MLRGIFCENTPFHLGQNKAPSPMLRGIFCENTSFHLGQYKATLPDVTARAYGSDVPFHLWRLGHKTRQDMQSMKKAEKRRL